MLDRLVSFGSQLGHRTVQPAVRIRIFGNLGSITMALVGSLPFLLVACCHPYFHAGRRKHGTWALTLYQ